MKKLLKINCLLMAIAVLVASCKSCNAPANNPGSDSAKADSAKKDSIRKMTPMVDTAKKDSITPVGSGGPTHPTGN